MFPPHLLGDKVGDPFDLRNRIIYAFEAHNYYNRFDDTYIPININQIVSITLNPTKAKEIANKAWERFLLTPIGQNFETLKSHEKQYYRYQYYYKYYNSNVISVKFDNIQLHMPDYLQFQLYKCKVTCEDEGKNEIEKRTDEFYQCYHCSSAECRHRKCKEWGDMIDGYVLGNDDSYGEARNKIKKYCDPCGHSGGHGRNKCNELPPGILMRCKKCTQTNHNNKKN